MNRNRVMHLSLIVSMLSATGALAAEVQGKSSTRANAVAETKYAQANAGGSVEAEAQAKADLEHKRQEIEQRAARVSAKAKARAEAELNKAANQVEAEAKKAENTVAGRLAAEFDATAESMVEQQSSLDASWGDLMIAHTLKANSKSAVDVSQMIELEKGGLGWGTIAAGLGLDLNSVVTSVKAEQRVAQGLAKADGKVAVIRGEGARVGLGANAGVGAAANAGNAGTVTTGLGVGAGVKIGK